jgi:energy-coupling factor transport system ATP-binding protein
VGRLLPEVDRVAALGERGRLDAWGAPADVLRRLPDGGPLIEAARALGMPAGLGEQALRSLRKRLLAWHAPRNAAPAGEVRLAARSLGFTFSNGFELQPVDLDLRRGEALAVLGGNGSGKTTLLRCLMGLLAHRGEVRLEGRRIDGQPVALRARRLAYVPQWPSAFLFADTVRDELWTTLRYRGLQAQAAESVEAMLGVFALTEVAGRYPRDLSAGERQRTALAAVMIAAPACVLLDEPTLGMDAASQAQLARRIRGWKRSGLSVMVATHDVEFAAAFSERALVLERGRVAAVGDTPQLLFDRPHLRTALQQLTGRVHPACVSDLVTDTGGEDADA